MTNTAAFGVETGSPQIIALNFDFPTSLNGVAPDAPATKKTEETRGLINQAQRAVQNLPFWSNVNY